MKKEINVFVHREKSHFGDDYSYTAQSCDMSDYGYVLLGQQTIMFEIPSENDMVKKEIDMLNAKANKLKLDAHLAVEKIEEKIQSLLAIEDKSSLS